MQEAVPPGSGGMAAILGLDDEQVRTVCSEAGQGEVVEAVNFNSPGQVVIAGSKAAVDRACVLAKDAGAKRALPLPVSVPSHCALMQPAAERLSERLRDIRLEAPEIPVLHNVNVQSESDADSIRQLLAAQLHSPVRWVETVQKMATVGVDRLYEAGPGKVLAGLTKRIDKTIKGVGVFDPDSLKDALEAAK
jgi:[acyl-carrier-protein] S-malonyltransferase